MTVRERMIEALKQAFPQAVIQLSSDDDVHFELVIAETSFHGQDRVWQHRQVYQALGHLMQNACHALSIKIMEHPDAISTR